VAAPTKKHVKKHVLWSFAPNARLPVKQNMYPDSKSRSQKLYDRALTSPPGGNTRTTMFMKA